MRQGRDKGEAKEGQKKDKGETTDYKTDGKGLNKNKRDMEKELTYTAAFEELKEIVDQLENDSVSVDELTEKMKRATVLMKICRDKLTKTEEEVNKTIEELS